MHYNIDTDFAVQSAQATLELGLLGSLDANGSVARLRHGRYITCNLLLRVAWLIEDCEAELNCRSWIYDPTNRNLRTASPCLSSALQLDSKLGSFIRWKLETDDKEGHLPSEFEIMRELRVTSCILEAIASAFNDFLRSLEYLTIAGARSGLGACQALWRSHVGDTPDS